MAYFDTDKTISAAPVTVTDTKTHLRRLIRILAAYLAKPRKGMKRKPEDLLAAQNRAETHRRAVDNLMR
ncbi:hypothetical protein [Marivita hallyeonensis]|uniref:Uncharacterized protein n=1 Tax=Marivita hallyeonensis TaxID=996342 RepID=A0A1M5W664_9RHOB|nr:hypothetical protein [Marivita hallyeonensis]SHH82951.1 hypothetical protein SAMN05443551_3280 [Marivita hallyeonensis]